MTEITGLPLGPLMTNCYFVRDTETGDAVVVDPGGFSPALVRQAELVGKENVKGILLTHCHFDHIMGVAQLKRLTGMTGAVPSSPPSSMLSPSFFPITGMILTAVVLLLITPIAASSAMIPEIVAALVSPGIAIMSRPTEQTQVIASSFSSDSAPFRTAAIIPSSSLTGINAPLSPPT